MGQTDGLTDGAASASIPAVSIVEHVSNYERSMNLLRGSHIGWRMGIESWMGYLLLLEILLFSCLSSIQIIVF